MARESVVDQIVRSLSFEVEAVPQDNATKLTSTSNSTPLNVKIRVRKKDESGMQQGILSVPKFGSPDANPERIRLISSDQTIMSFNVSMEADFVKKPKRKPRKLFFGGCLGTQYDDDEVPYTPSSAYNAKITGTSTSCKSEGVIRQKFTLSKTNYDNIDALQQYSKKHSILGKCKPGGCLDPPFSEEKYSYVPIKISKERKPIELVTKDAVKQHAKIRLNKADNAHRTSKESKQLSKDSLIQKPKAKTGDDSLSVLSIYDKSLQGSLDSKYSDSVITYPPLASPIAITNEKTSRNRISSDEKPQKSYNDSIDAFFSSPRKSSRFSENTYNSADETKKDNAKTIIPIPLPIPIPLRNATDGTDNTKKEYTNTVIPKPMINAPKGTDGTKRENLETIIPVSLKNSTISKSSVSFNTSPQVFNSVSPKKTVFGSEPTLKIKLNKAVLSTNNAKLDDLQKQSSYTDNLENAKANIPVPKLIPLKKETTISSSDKSNIISPQVRDSVSPQKTFLESEPSMISHEGKADLSTNNTKFDELQEQSSYSVNLENDKTSIPIPIPITLKKVTTISSSGESHITSPQVRDSVSPQKTVLKSEPSMSFGESRITSPQVRDSVSTKKIVLKLEPFKISKEDKADLSTNNAKLDDLQKQSSYSDNYENVETSVPIPIPIPLKKGTSITSSGDSHITLPQVQDSVSQKKTFLKSDLSIISKVEKPDLSTNNAKLDHLKEQLSCADNLENDETSIPIPTPVPLKKVTTISSSGESHITSARDHNSVSPKKSVLESEPSMISKADKADLSTNNAKLNNLEEQSFYTDSLDHINNEAKLAEPMIQSSYVGSIKNIPVTKGTEDKKDVLSYPEPYVDKSKLLEQSLKNKLDDKELAMQEQYRSASNKIKKHGEKESLTSIHELKTQSNDYSPDKILQNQSRATSNHVLHSNGYKSIDESKQRTLPSESENFLEDFDVKSGHFLNPDEQADNISKQTYTDYIPKEYDHPKIIKNNENLAEDNAKQLNKLSFPSASTISKDDKRKNIKSITDMGTYETPINSIPNKSIKLNQSIAKDIDYKEGNKTQLVANEDFGTELILPKKYLSLDNNIQQDTTEGMTFDKENNVTKNKTIIISNDQDAEPIKYNRFLKPVNEGDSKRNIDEEDNFTLIPETNINEEDYVSLIPKHARSNLDDEELSKHDLSHVEKLTDPNNNDSKSKQSSFVKEFSRAEENLNAISSIAMSNTNDQQSPDMPMDKSVFVDSLTRPSESVRVETHKYRPSIDRLATREQSKDSMRNELHKLLGRPTIEQISTHSDQNQVSMSNKIHQYRGKPTIERISTQSDQSKDMRNEIRQYRGRPTMERISTQIEQSKDSMRNHTHKYRPTIERISIQAEHKKDSANLSKLILKPASVITDSEDNAENINEASEISPETSSTIGSISLDLAFQSYVNDKNERTLKTIDMSVDHVRYPDDSITVIQSHLRHKVKEIRIPIDTDNDMTIQIQPTKSPMQPLHIPQQEPFDFNKPVATLSDTFGLSDVPNVNNYDSYLQGRHENMSYTDIPTILNSVYEQELIPLHNTINHLKKEIDALASQQSILIDKLISARRTKPTRLLRVSSRCLCYR